MMGCTDIQVRPSRLPRGLRATRSSQRDILNSTDYQQLRSQSFLILFKLLLNDNITKATVLAVNHYVSNPNNLNNPRSPSSPGNVGKREKEPSSGTQPLSNQQHTSSINGVVLNISEITWWYTCLQEVCIIYICFS